MKEFHFLAWLYWDPRREAFTLPFFDLSIAWYGIIFALGFIIGYFLLLPIFKQFIWESKEVFPRDIVNWKNLAFQFKNDDRYLSKLNRKSREELEQLSKEGTPSNSLKQEMLDVLNSQLKGDSIDRKSMEIFFPGAIVKARDLSIAFADQLTWFVVIGTIVGARLGHVFFYDWPYFQNHLIEIFMLRNGGLASHGGTVGVLIGLCLFLYWNKKSFPDFTFVSLLDILMLPTAFVAFCIRIANFFNQEILGIETSVPWAVVFGHPADNTIPAPRHPVQLYEAVAYLAIFFFIFFLRKTGRKLKPGTISGLFFLLLFGVRFLIEFLKMPQSMLINESPIQMGQYLSLPFIILGAGLLLLRRSSNRINA